MLTKRSPLVGLWAATALAFACNGIAVAITRDDNHIAPAVVLIAVGTFAWAVTAVRTVRWLVR